MDYGMAKEDLLKAQEMAEVLGTSVLRVVQTPFKDLALELLKKSKSKGINVLCEEAYETALSKGWHDTPREMGTVLALIHAEVSEALEAHRRKEGYERFMEELADVCIRVFDLCGDHGFDLEGAIYKKMMFNKDRSYKHGGKEY